MPKKGFRSGDIKTCPECKKESYLYPSQIKRGYTFCSKLCWYKNMKGENNPNYGNKLSEDIRKIISEKKKGKTLVDLHGETKAEQIREKLKKASRRNAKRGAKNNLWKGGVSSERNRLGKSTMWLDWRKSVFERDKYFCRKCKKIGGKINPHHIYNFSQYKALRFIMENGITLCVPCHRQFHIKYGKQNNTQKQIEEYIGENLEYTIII
jgi:5-methylcytosine-specific restriction endonuclease McrA